MKSIAWNIIYSGTIRMKISRLQYTRDAKEKEKTKDKKKNKKKVVRNPLEEPPDKGKPNPIRIRDI